DGKLDVTETWTYQTTKPAKIGKETSIGTVTGTPVGGGALATSTNPDNYFGASAGIKIVKKTNGTDNDTAPGPAVAVGSPVVWTYTVKNTGNVALTTVVVTDDNGTPGSVADDFSPTFVGGDTNNDGKLDVTETWTYQATKPA